MAIATQTAHISQAITFSKRTEPTSMLTVNNTYLALFEYASVSDEGSHCFPP